MGYFYTAGTPQFLWVGTLISVTLQEECFSLTVDPPLGPDRHDPIPWHNGLEATASWLTANGYTIKGMSRKRAS